MGTPVLGTRFRGCSNFVVQRSAPHSSLGYLTPNEFIAQGATQRPVKQRAGTLRYQPLLNRPVGDKCSEPVI